MKPAKLAIELVRAPYAWPGGYPMYAITDDGGVLCKSCCKSELHCIRHSTPGDGWHVGALVVNWEETDLYCDHCNTLIECAYGE